MADAWDQFPDANAAKAAADPFAQFPDHPAANRMAFAPSDLASYAPPVSVGRDVLHSLGTGLAKGGIGLSTIAGNLEGLGRAGFNKAFDLGTKLALGQNANVPSPISNQTFFPTAGEVTNKLEHDYGKFYQPQTVPGQYAETAGEFAPGALAGGPETSLLTRALNVAVPAVTSEAAGQLTAGTPLEPYARTAGALVSGKLPNVANVPMRAVSPLAADATRLANVANLEKQGVTALSAGEKTGNRGLRYMESMAADTPFGGGGARSMEIEKGQQATAAAWKHAGFDADNVRPETVDAAFDSLGATYNGLAKMTNFKVDSTLTNALKKVGDAYDDRTAPFNRNPLVQKIIGDITNLGASGATLGGDKYQGIRSAIGEEIKIARRDDPRLMNALGGIQEALDNAMMRYSSPKVAAAWKDTNAKYRNLLAIADASAAAGENSANGILSMPALRNALVKQETRQGYAKSTRPLVQFARSAEGVMKPLPNSGTAARQQLGEYAKAAGTGGALGMLAGGTPGAALGALSGPAVRSLAAWGLMTKPVQALLSNQLMAKPLAAYQAGQSIPWWFLPQGLSPAAEAEAASEAKKKKGSP